MRLTLIRQPFRKVYASTAPGFMVYVVDGVEQTYEIDIMREHYHSHMTSLVTAAFTHIIWRLPAGWHTVAGFLPMLGFGWDAFYEAGGDSNEAHLVSLIGHCGNEATK